MLKQYLPIYAELVVSCLQREAVIEQQQQQSQRVLRQNHSSINSVVGMPSTEATVTQTIVGSFPTFST